MRAVAVGLVLAAVAAGPAQAASERSETVRLEDRREVAAGTRAQVLGFQDGRFYANGWHITGEMGGIVTPPLKLLDSLSFGVEGQWVGPATRFTSGWGYARYDLPSIDGLRLRRTDVAPDGLRGALLGLEVTNPAPRTRTVDVMVDAAGNPVAATEFPALRTLPVVRPAHINASGYALMDFAAGPPAYCPIDPSVRTTRWHGMATATRLEAHAEATARTAAGEPMRSAISE